MTVIDEGADRDRRPVKPCARRLEHGGWCTLPDQHDPAPCDGPALAIGPVVHFDRHLWASYRLEVSRKWDDKRRKPDEPSPAEIWLDEAEGRRERSRG